MKILRVMKFKEETKTRNFNNNKSLEIAKKKRGGGG